MTALAYLRSIEWAHPQAEGSCPKCGWSKQEVAKFGGHSKTCPLAAAIADAEELGKRRGLRSKAEVEKTLSLLNAPGTRCVCDKCSALRWVLGEE